MVTQHNGVFGNGSRRLRSGFTLIELLVVIAIIAILAAILFPVFASVRENARQATVISNMHQVQLALGQFQLDNRKYPDVLFGYAYPPNAPVAMDKAYNQVEADHQADPTNPAKNPSAYFPGLYPQFVKDVRIFEDPNNPNNSLTATATAQINVLDTSTNALTPTSRTFYTADALDLSPQITGANSLSSTVFVPRYQTSWTDLNASMNVIDPATGRNDYQRQLRWRTVPGDTYVTCTTYHVPNAGKVIVLFESGAAKIMDTSQFLVNSNGQDASTIAPSGGQSQATFWKVSPNGK